MSDQPTPSSTTGPDHRGDQLAHDPTADDPVWERLEDQIDWYDRKSVAAQRAYKRFKLAELVVATAVPVVAALRVAAAVTAVLAAVVVIAEGVQQLYQWQTNWLLYRSTAEALKHEKYLYLAAAGPYATTNRRSILAQRLEGLISQEHAKWTDSYEQAKRTPTTLASSQSPDHHKIPDYCGSRK